MCMIYDYDAYGACMSAYMSLQGEKNMFGGVDGFFENVASHHCLHHHVLI